MGKFVKVRKGWRVTTGFNTCEGETTLWQGSSEELLEELKQNRQEVCVKWVEEVIVQELESDILYKSYSEYVYSSLEEAEAGVSKQLAYYTIHGVRDVSFLKNNSQASHLMRLYLEVLEVMEGS